MTESARTRRVIRGTAMVVVYIWSAVIALNGLQLDKNWLKVLGAVPLALALLFTLFDKLLWHLGWFLRLAATPDLRGTWLGTLSSEYLDDRGRLQRMQGPVAIVIRQSFSEISIVALTEKSRSYSTLARIQRQSSGEFHVDYLYANSPHMEHREELTNHFGSSSFLVPSVRPLKFTGSYWTDRLSRGSLDLSWLSSRRVSELADAQALPKESREEIN